MRTDARAGAPDWLMQLAGAEAFCSYLRSLGRDASVVPVPQRTAPNDDGPVSSSRGRHLVVINQSPIHLVSLRLSHDVTGNGSSSVIPLAHHYVVRTEHQDEAAYDARLGQSFGGWLRKTRTRLTFVGGLLAERLRADDAVRAAFFGHLAPGDDLIVAPDVTRGLVRIVHVHPISGRRPLWPRHASTFHEEFLPEPLLLGIERIAEHVRDIAQLSRLPTPASAPSAPPSAPPSAQSAHSLSQSR